MVTLYTLNSNVNRHMKETINMKCQAPVKILIFCIGKCQALFSLEKK